jgi:hypothetical protein
VTHGSDPYVYYRKLVGENHMNPCTRRSALGCLLLAGVVLATGCSSSSDGQAGSSSGSDTLNKGSIEVTARLVEIPEGAIFDRPLYNYATVLKYEVLETHRGRVKGQTIYVGHYNPAKPRSEAANQYCKDVGGNLKVFRAGQVHRMALDASMLDQFTGGVLNLYSEEDVDPIYWAVWTDLVSG